MSLEERPKSVPPKVGAVPQLRTAPKLSPAPKLTPPTEKAEKPKPAKQSRTEKLKPAKQLRTGKPVVAPSLQRPAAPSRPVAPAPAPLTEPESLQDLMATPITPPPASQFNFGAPETTPAAPPKQSRFSRKKKNVITEEETTPTPAAPKPPVASAPFRFDPDSTPSKQPEPSTPNIPTVQSGTKPSGPFTLKDMDSPGESQFHFAPPKKVESAAPFTTSEKATEAAAPAKKRRGGNRKQKKKEKKAEKGAFNIKRFITGLIFLTLIGLIAYFALTPGAWDDLRSGKIVERTQVCEVTAVNSSYFFDTTCGVFKWGDADGKPQDHLTVGSQYRFTATGVRIAVFNVYPELLKVEAA